MNKKGFTLVELIAIIIIFSAITILSFSSLTNTLKKTHLKEVEDYKLKVETAAQIYVETELMRYEPFNVGTYMKIGIEELLNKGYINDDIDVVDQCTFEKVTIFVYKNYDKTITYYVKCDNDYEYYANGMPIYFNPITGLSCTDYVNNNSNTGNTAGCMKWYTFNDREDSDTINLILDHNTTAVVAWNLTAGSTTIAQVATALANNTSGWISGLNQRLLTVDEITKITSKNSFNVVNAGSWFFLDTNTTTKSETCTTGNITGCKYGWLYDRVSTTCNTTGCLNNADAGMTGYGYWTSNAVGTTGDAWRIWYDGSLRASHVELSSYYGVRPVITISKDLLQ